MNFDASNSNLQQTGKRAKRSRTHGKTISVAAKIRSLILSGQWALGSQLPTWDKMILSFDVSRVTLFHALAILKSDGYIYSASRKGTYVSPHTPSNCNFALVSQNSPTSAIWSHFGVTLLSVIDAMNKRANPQQQILQYFNIDGHTDHADYQRLIYDITHHRLAGLIFHRGWYDLTTHLKDPSPLLDLPQIVLGPFCSQKNKDLIQIHMEGRSFQHKACQWLIDRNRKHVAVIGMFTDPLVPLLEKHGLKCPKAWRINLSKTTTDAAETFVRLLFQTSEQTPDAIIIADDNFIPATTRGLLAMNVRVGQDVDVITHCNWPYPIPSSLPLKYLGYDCQKLLDLSIKAIRDKRQGLAVEASQLINAEFDHERSSVDII